MHAGSQRIRLACTAHLIAAVEETQQAGNAALSLPSHVAKMPRARRRFPEVRLPASV